MRHVVAVIALCCLASSCQRQDATPASTPTTSPPPAAAAALKPKPVKPPDALASENTNWGSTVADVLEFRRTGNVLTAIVRLRGPGLVSFHFSSAFVLDEAQGKKYKVLADEKGDLIACCHGVVMVAAESPLTHWMKFPAPPPEVKTATLVFPETTPFENLPIQDR